MLIFGYLTGNFSISWPGFQALFSLSASNHAVTLKPAMLQGLDFLVTLAAPDYGTTFVCDLTATFKS